MTEQGENLTLIKEGMESLIPAEVCVRYEECQKLQEEYVEVADRWHKLQDRLQENLQLLDQKVCKDSLYSGSNYRYEIKRLLVVTKNILAKTWD